MKRLIIITLMLTQACATAPRPVTGSCAQVDRVESAGPGARRWAVFADEDGIEYAVPIDGYPQHLRRVFADGAEFCGHEPIADLWEPHRLFDCLESGQDVNTCMSGEG